MGSTGTDRTRCGECGREYSGSGACPSCLLQLGLGGLDSEVAEIGTLAEPPARSRDTDSPTIEHFEILESIGSGGMGEVYAAQQLAPVRRRVALKVIKWGMDTREVVARFESERQALALMNHPAIARVYEAGATTEGRPFFAMELVDGEPITQFCDEHQLTTRARIDLFLQVCDGVHHAHRKGIIHRDLKPSNILASAGDEGRSVKVIDFGIAKATEHHLTEHTVYTEQGILIGTPEYMSPEQAELSAFDIDTRSDVYSLGVLLYELLTGLLPVESERLREGSLLEIQRRIVEHEPPKPSTRINRAGDAARDTASRRGTDPRALRRALSGDLDWIVMKALEKDPDRRYDSAAALRLDLERYLRHEPVTAGPPDLGYRSMKFARRHRTAVGGAAAILVALVVGLVVSVTGLASAREAEAIASLERDKAEAVNRFLVETFGAANPYGESGRDVTVAESLELAVDRLDEAFDEQPDVRNELRRTIGESYLRLGKYDRAEPLLRDALADVERRFPPGDPAIAEAQDVLGLLLAEGAEFAEAADLMEKALATRRSEFGRTSVEATGTATHLSIALVRLARLDEAIDLLQTTIEDKIAGGLGPESIGVTYNNLGIAYSRADRPKDAEEAFARAVELRSEGNGPNSPEVAESLTGLAGAYKSQERYEEAEEHYLRSMELLYGHLGPEHPRIATVHNNLGGNYYRMRDFESAKEHYDKAFEVLSLSIDGDHPRIASMLNNRANNDAELGDFAESERKHRASLAMRKRLFGEIHPSVALSLSGLGSTLSDSGRPAEAIPLFRESLRIYYELDSERRWRTASVEGHLGAALTASGEYAEAEPTLLGAHEILVRERGSDHHQTKLTARRLVDLYEATGHEALADRYRAEALDEEGSAGS